MPANTAWQSAALLAVARQDRALERAEVLLRNWNRRSHAISSAEDPSAAREYAEIKRAVLTQGKRMCWGLSSNGTEMYAKGVDRYLPEMRLCRIQE